MEISELKEKVKHTEQMELQKADHAQSQLIVEELLGKVASLERNLEVEKKEKESIIHEILNLQVDLRKKEDEMDIYKETLKVTEGALTKEQNERELLGEQARQRLQECQENEKKLDLKVKELTAEVERWKKEVDLHVEAEARLMENRSQEEVASSEQAKPENNQQPSPGNLTVLMTLLFLFCCLCFCICVAHTVHIAISGHMSQGSRKELRKQRISLHTQTGVGFEYV